jgi:hypothetical protein
MYTISVYAICVGLTLLVGAALFAACAILFITKEICLMLVAMTGKILVRVRFSAAQALSVHDLPHFEGSSRMRWTGVVVSHIAVPARSLIRMR